MIETPAMRRSAMLAQMLQQMQQQPPEQISSYGQLGAELLAKGITQWSANRANRDVQTERTERMGSQRDALLANLPPVDGPAPSGAALGAALSPPPVTNTQEPQQAPIAPAAPIQGAPLPPQGVMPAPAPMAAAPVPMPAPQAPPQNPLGPTPQEIAMIRQAAASGDPGQLAWAQQTWSEIQMRMATPPEIDIAIGPDGTPYNTNDPSALNRTFRNVENIKGFLVDTNAADNVGRYIPDLQPGEEPVYDQNRNIVGVRNLAGAIEALGARERATADASNASRASYAGVTAGAEAAARAPYQFVNVQSPTGAPTTMSAAAAAGGVFQGQTPADAIREEGAARREVATGDVTAQRSREAPERVRRYEEALALIPKAITGFGSDARVAAARLAAASGNQEARDAVAATEVYQNLIGRDIGAIVREMVGSANISNSDRELATRIAGGDTNITPQALTRIVNYELSRQIGYMAASGRPLSAAQARRLPRGTEFTGEDGQRYRVP
jgi:hypothetical protein